MNFFGMLRRNHRIFILLFLSILSLGTFIFYYSNGLGLIYNDAKSHLDIGRRIVEGLTPGLIQLGGVWLPLPHLLMVPTIWNDFMWHSGLSGALQSMASYVAIGLLIYLFLQKLGVWLWGRLAGVLAFALNSNVLYLQSTAMTELLLMATMLAGCYELLLWHKNEKLYFLIKSAFWIMLATLIRYDGWFLFAFAVLLILIHSLKRYGIKYLENTLIPFIVLGGLGIALWLSWNYIIFKDIFYFALGPYSAHEQQLTFLQRGALLTEHNVSLAVTSYLYAVLANAGWFVTLFGIIGIVFFWFDKHISFSLKLASLALFSPLFFNVLALYFGYSILLVPGITGDIWFNARYGLMMIPAFAIFFGYLVHRFTMLQFVLIGILVIVSAITFGAQESVLIKDAFSGGSGSDVSKVSSFLSTHASNTNDYILIATSSHDPIIFSSKLSMKRFVHQGTGFYWDLAVAHPDRYIRYIVMRTGDDTDLVYRMLSDNASFKQYYNKVGSFPTVDVYELKSERRNNIRPFPKF